MSRAAAPVDTAPQGGFLRRVVHIEPGEGRAVGWAFAYFFFLLSSYYVIRPLRDALGLAGEDRLTVLYLGSLAGTMLANPILGALVSRYPRRVFLPAVYHVLTAALLGFYALLASTSGPRQLAVGRVFFVWVSVFNLFAVSVFWGFMADLFRSGQGKRLFGFIGLGGTLGAIAGASSTALLAAWIGPTQLILVAAGFLQAAILCIRRLVAAAEPGAVLHPSAGVARAGTVSPDNDAPPDAPPGHGVLSGLRLVLRSPYLLGICLFLLFYTVSSTLIYFEQARIVRASLTDHAERTAFFARIDLYTNVVTALVQLLASGTVLQTLGVGRTLAALPTITMAGFGALALAPATSMLTLFQVVRRGAEFSLVRPAREVLFTVVSREEKYVSKNLIDTFVYRAGDVAGALLDSALATVRLSPAQVPAVFLPIAAAWVGLSLWLGRLQAAAARQRGD